MQKDEKDVSLPCATPLFSAQNSLLPLLFTTRAHVGGGEILWITWENTALIWTSSDENAAS